jgi:cystathionine beta-lyase/cystathionine gamma-synthase
LIERINYRLGHWGGSLDPHACFLLHRGLKTLAVRVRHQNESTLRIARFLENHPKIEMVYYPGLERSPEHLRACELLEGFGGVLSFEVAGGVAAAEALIKRMTIPICAPSLGGVESLITRPATTSHAGMSREERERIGIREGLVRLSVGLEASEDLIEDFEQGLASI